VTESLDTQLLRADFEVEWLVDSDASFHNAGRDIQRHVEQALKGLWQ
jgi:hypothetical protein